MASRKRKTNLTEDQILSFILSGGNVEDLYDNTNVSVQQVVAALVKRPELLSSLKQQAEQQAADLESYNERLTYADERTLKNIVNPVSARYDAMAQTNPRAAAFAQRYFTEIRSVGNNPLEQDRIYANMKTVGPVDYGLSEEETATLLDQLEADRDEQYKAQINTERRKQKENYKAFQQLRKDLKLQAGETVAQKYFTDLTGLPELMDLPDYKESFQGRAKRLAMEKVTKPTGGAKISDIPDERKQFERVYLREIEKAGKLKSTPYKEAVKRLLPQIVANRKLTK